MATTKKKIGEIRKQLSSSERWQAHLLHLKTKPLYDERGDPTEAAQGVLLTAWKDGGFHEFYATDPWLVAQQKTALEMVKQKRERVQLNPLPFDPHQGDL